MNLNTCSRCGYQWHSEMIEHLCDDCLADGGGSPFDDDGERESFIAAAYGAAELFLYAMISAASIAALIYALIA